MTTIHRPPAPQLRRRAAEPWSGEYRRYDLVKEFVAAVVVMAALTTLLAVLFGSPDKPGVTVAQWARNDPGDFATTTVSELDGTSTSATYGPPYIHDPSAGQKIGPVATQQWGGVRSPVDPPVDFVLGPLHTIPGDPVLAAALTRYEQATPAQQQAWAKAYADALDAAPGHDPAMVSGTGFGPVPLLVTGELAFARTGGLDGALLAEAGPYPANLTRPLLFLADGGYLADQANAEHLTGHQWGMMNETGHYPGQTWLWLYTFWYQIPPFSSSGNADALVWGLMMLLSLALVLVPFIPGVRSIPRWVPVYRLIWRDHYRRQRAG